MVVLVLTYRASILDVARHTITASTEAILRSDAHIRLDEWSLWMHEARVAMRELCVIDRNETETASRVCLITMRETRRNYIGRAPREFAVGFRRVVSSCLTIMIADGKWPNERSLERWSDGRRIEMQGPFTRSNSSPELTDRRSRPQRALRYTWRSADPRIGAARA